MCSASLEASLHTMASRSSLSTVMPMAIVFRGTRTYNITSHSIPSHSMDRYFIRIFSDYILS